MLSEHNPTRERDHEALASTWPPEEQSHLHANPIADSQQLSSS